MRTNCTRTSANEEQRPQLHTYRKPSSPCLDHSLGNICSSEICQAFLLQLLQEAVWVLGKAAFKWLGGSSRNRSAFCHTTSNACAVGSNVLLSNDRKDSDLWKISEDPSMSTSVQGDVIHSVVLKTSSRIAPNLLRASFISVVGKLEELVTSVKDNFNSPSHGTLLHRWNSGFNTASLAFWPFNFLSLLFSPIQ